MSLPPVNTFDVAASRVPEPNDDRRALRETVERAPVGIAHFDPTGRFLFVNPMMCAIFGLSREQLLRTTFQQISFPDDLPACLELNAQLTAGAIPRYTHEKRFRRPDGSQVYVRVIVTAVRDSGGGIAFFLGVVEDLSEQWAAAAARRAAEERLQLALEASGTGIYRYDFRAEALDYSNGLARVFGFPEGERLHSLRRLLDAIHPDDLPGVLAAYQRSVTGGADFDEEFRIVLPDGSIRWISDRARMTLDGQGRAHYLTGACIDVTARRLAEAEREQLLEAERRARADAEHAAKLRDEVLAIVAHDLRNPVHTIMMSAGAMAELPLSPEDSARQVGLIRRAAGGMDRLIRDLLDVTSIETGKLAINPTRVAMAELITECVTVLSPKLEQAGLTLTAEVDASVGDVQCDRERIGQVMGNLLGNAIKFTPAGGRITVGAGRTGEKILISVSDTGVGLSATARSRMFERYWQADRGSGQGVGLGLAIVRGIVDAHGGTIEVESALGKGTTVTVALPAGHERS